MWILASGVHEKWRNKTEKSLSLSLKNVKKAEKHNEEIYCDTHFSLTLWRLKWRVNKVKRHAVSAHRVNRGEIAQYSQQTRGRDSCQVMLSKHDNKEGEWEGWESRTGSY